ncbi:MAG: UvrD-helicase domain-containing protein [Lachnospiraceae bacterium]|nr:UvrD-helicase domain-containing protein [Lachnospiraceae bacterium]
MEEKEILEKLNPEQQDAVRTTEGPVLILAGAGSGKTRVLVHRISYLINVCGVWPGNILAITFTNKAADEMKSRVDDLIGFGSDKIWVMTFHAACVRILRRHAEELGYTRYFTIYDTDDSMSVMKDIFRLKKIDTKRMKERQVLSMISSAKNELITPEKYAEAAGRDFFSRQIEGLYAEYQSRLKANNAMDFDDLIGNTVKLFKEHPEILEMYQEKFRYLMVDEYQDTNTAQFKFVSLLADKYRNLCVVGDDDQSIYKFRGANIRNILNFEQIFPESKVVRLEQNYRSTGNILDAANNVIRNNRGRKAKKLWTENETGRKVRFRKFMNSFDEAEFIAEEIRDSVRKGESDYKDYAVLYRTNAQSRLFEEKFMLLNVPYKMVGGVNFYARKEIKDLLAYLKTTANAVDDLASTRIINIPKRGIGQTTVTKILAYAGDGGLSFYEGAKDADRIGSLSAATVKKVKSFTDFIEELREAAKELSVSALLRKIVEDTDYEGMLREQDDEDVVEERLGNIEELVNKAIQYETDQEEPSLSGFLAEVALVADIDSVDDGDDRVLLMTLHSAKGLEFPDVYLTGMEEGVFPGMMSLSSESPLEEIEEERRLCYVGITRAKKRLTLTAAGERMVRGNVERHPVSRFVREIPRDMLDNGLPESGSGVRMRAPSSVLPEMRKAMQAEAPKKYDNPYIRKENAPAKPKPFAGLSYKVGDKVSHVKYGIGTVKEIREGKRDYEVTVDFQTWGVKRLLAAFANLTPAE